MPLFVLLISLLLSAPINSIESAQGTITATASVTPVIGLMPQITELPNESASHDAFLFQIPKNSAFHFHVQIDGMSPSRITYKKITQNFNAASDLISISFPTHTTNSSNHIITVITSEN